MVSTTEGYSGPSGEVDAEKDRNALQYAPDRLDSEPEDKFRSNIGVSPLYTTRDGYEDLIKIHSKAIDSSNSSSGEASRSDNAAEAIELGERDGVVSDAGRAPSEDRQHRHKGLAASIAGHARDVPRFLKPSDRLTAVWHHTNTFCLQHLNFYRVHLLIFTFTPLIFSVIFWASNVTPISYIDCLFVCVSSMTVTGLTTINISTATPWQQAIMYFLMSIGHISAVSIVMILIRRHFFQVKFDAIIRRSAKVRKRMNDVELAHQRERRKGLIRLQRLVGLRKDERDDSLEDMPESGQDAADRTEQSPRSSASTNEIAEAELRAERKARKKDKTRKKQPLRANMIRRMDQPAVLINPMGAISNPIGEREQHESHDARHASFSITQVANTPLGGGILNNSTEDRTTQDVTGMKRLSNGEEQIRIEEPEVGPSHLSGLNDQDVERPRQSASPTRMNAQEEAQMQSHVDSSLRSRRRSTVSFGQVTRDGGEGAVPSIGVLKAVPTGDSEHDDEAADQVTRLKSGSDPPVTAPARFGHMRHGSDVQTGARTAFRTDMFPRAQTIEFAEPPRSAGLHTFQHGARSTAIPYSHSHGQDLGMRHRTHTIEFDHAPPTIAESRKGSMGLRRTKTAGLDMSRTLTMSKNTGFGGFPTPLEVAGAVFKRALPGVQERFKRSTTMARTATFASTHSAGGMTFDGATVRSAPYLSFDATVSRNSRFHQLTEAQRDELGGVEYRAIDMLSKLIPIYWLGLYFIVIVLVAPWLASKPGQRTRDVLAQQGQYGVGTTWFWFFQVTSAYSNTGLSLIDTSMIQLNDQYMMLIPMAFMILAGNTAFPILLRLFVWLLSLMVPRKSRSYETLRFLLDHPRRCFIYLFPSAQTWFLLMVLIVLNSFDWIMFEILDLKNPTLDAFQTGVRVFDGLFQSIAVRAAGFQIVSLLVLAPAVQFLYIVMMYISAYPVAMSVRNTNVYEERSLGIFNEEADGEQDEPEQGGARVWGTYLAAHARRQLAFDMWWLGFALWLVCIIEKDNIQDPETNGWFTVFSCLFELTSAYGTVGLSTGTPVDNFSLSGRFHTLSKLVVIAVMLRGRHRGLPVAIDRAVLLPGDFEIADDMHERAYTIDEDGMIRSKSTYNPLTTREHGGGYEAGYEDAAEPTSPHPLHASTASTTRLFKAASETPSASHQGGQYDGVAKRDSTDSDRKREHELTKQCCSAGEEVEEAKRGVTDPRLDD